MYETESGGAFLNLIQDGDTYHYFCGNSYLTVFLPAWFTENLEQNLENSRAVSKMSGKTADWFGIQDRGKIKPGQYADLVLFNPETIADHTTIKDTARQPTGIEKVMSNGQWVVGNGQYVQGIKPGEHIWTQLRIRQ